MFLVFLLLFLLLPALEIYLLFQVGYLIGFWDTFLLVIVMGVVGAYYARREGIGVLLRMQRDSAEGRMPAGAMFDGALVLFGGALLITPGFVTDLIGFTMIFPPTRKLWKLAFALWIRKKMARGEIIFRRY